MPAELRRATSLDELGDKASRLVTRESYDAGRAFVPRPTDIIISPFAKCGTTWLQQMVHTLRTGGDLDFDDISSVVPWLETALDVGIDLQATQRAEPRAFKSHLSWDDVPKGARYIVSVRDPRDAYVSQYQFFEGWFFEPGSIDIGEPARAMFLKGRHYYSHLLSWLGRSSDPDSLLLAYEQATKDHEGTVRRVAEFVGFGGDEDRIAAAIEESSLKSMKAHEDKYSDPMMRARSETACDLPLGGDSRKVRDGIVGSHRYELSGTLLEEFDVAWAETIEAELGFANYEVLLDSLARC
jgi:hypothetical protein